MILRKKVIDLADHGDQCGGKVTIGELTFEQIESHLSEEATDRPKLALKTAELVSMSLNNARAEGEPEWNVDRCKKEIGWNLFWRVLPTEIMRFNGLDAAPATFSDKPNGVAKDAAAAAGEAAAASVN